MELRIDITDHVGPLVLPSQSDRAGSLANCEAIHPLHDGALWRLSREATLQNVRQLDAWALD